MNIAALKHVEGDISVAAERGGSRAGIPNRDKAEFLAMIQERVHEFTDLRRREEVRDLMETGMSEAEANAKARQDIIEDYDPVAQMALMAVDQRNKIDLRRQCHADVAQYVRPRLRSVEVSTDPEALETLTQREALSSRLVGLLVAAASAKKDAETGAPPAPEAPPE